jgi:hypothetical protein
MMFPLEASAQVWLRSKAPRLGSVEVSGGVIWSRGYDLGVRAAEETRNPGTGTGALDLFTSTSRLTTTVGGQGRVGVYLSHDLVLEAGFQYLQPKLSTRLSDDFEGATDVTATETITQYIVDGSLVVHLSRLSFAGGRGLPFLSGGGGYLRDVHETNQLIETGREYHAGAGIKLWFGPGVRHLGVRADVGVSIRDGGFDFNDTRRTVPTAGASVAYLF